jgi:hypothetical protein
MGGQFRPHLHRPAKARPQLGQLHQLAHHGRGVRRWQQGVEQALDEQQVAADRGVVLVRLAHEAAQVAAQPDLGREVQQHVPAHQAAAVVQAQRQLAMAEDLAPGVGHLAQGLVGEVAEAGEAAGQGRGLDVLLVPAGQVGQVFAQVEHDAHRMPLQQPRQVARPAQALGVEVLRGQPDPRHALHLVQQRLGHRAGAGVGIGLGAAQPGGQAVVGGASRPRGVADALGPQRVGVQGQEVLERGGAGLVQTDVDDDVGHAGRSRERVSVGKEAAKRSGRRHHRRAPPQPALTPARC